MKELRVDTHSVLSCTGSVSYGNNEETSASRRAFSRGDLLHFSAALPRQLGATSVRLLIKNDASGAVNSYTMRWVSLDGNRDVWFCELAENTLDAGLYFLRVDAETISGNVMSVRYDGENCYFAPEDAFNYSYQLTISEFKYMPPVWMQGGVIYQVFVDRFFRGSDTPVRSDAILNTDWENGIPQYPAYPGAPLANNMFFGGNLDGVTAKLDYIAALGVNCIYLSPIFRAYSNHKYDTGNYMEIDEMFGGEEAFKRLLSEAEKRHIRVILDGVFNHTGDDSLYFNRRGTYSELGAYQSKASPYYTWFDFQEHPNKYTCWWDIEILPRINPSVPACREYFLAKDGVIDKYAKMGIGGMRLDVVDELPDEFVAGIKARLTENTPDAILYGEVWEDASNKIAYDQRRKYYQGEELDGVMNYRLREGIIRYIRHGETDALRYALREVMPNAPKRVQDVQMNLFGSHDTERIITALAAEERGQHSNDELAGMRMSAEQRKKGTQRLKNAYTILATLPGVPLIYYGDEIGMEGYSDPFNRMPFRWHDMDGELLSHYRTLGELRRKANVYSDGGFELLKLDNDLLVFSRVAEEYRYITLINNSETDRQFAFDAKIKALTGGEVKGQTLLLKGMEGAVVRCKAGASCTVTCPQ